MLSRRYMNIQSEFSRHKLPICIQFEYDWLKSRCDESCNQSPDTEIKIAPRNVTFVYTERNWTRSPHAAVLRIYKQQPSVISIEKITTTPWTLERERFQRCQTISSTIIWTGATTSVWNCTNTSMWATAARAEVRGRWANTPTSTTPTDTVVKPWRSWWTTTKKTRWTKNPTESRTPHFQVFLFFYYERGTWCAI